MKYYYIFIWGDIEPYLSQQFLNTQERDKAARERRKKEGDNHGIYWLDVSSKGIPKIGPYRTID